MKTNKKSIISIIVGFYLILSIWLGFRFVLPYAVGYMEEDIPGPPGNSAGNIANLGAAAKQADWIYHIDTSKDVSNLYKVKTDGTNRTKLSNDYPSFINVVGDWVYYTNYSDGGRIYRIRTDGTRKTRLNKQISEYLNVVDGYIYYIAGQESGPIYRVRTNGSEMEKLSDDNASCLNVIDGWIYYRDGNYDISRMRVDGTEKTVVYNGKSAYFVNVSGNYIYYCDSSDNGSIYRMNLDGTNKIKLGSGHTVSLNVEGDWIYFVNRETEYSTYKMKLDGTGKTLVNTDASASINILEDWIYYDSLDDDHVLYKVKVDGALRQAVGRITKINSPGQIASALKDNIEFDIPDQKLKDAYEKAKEIVAKVVKPGMSDFEKEWALHQYVIKSSAYDTKLDLWDSYGSNSHTSYGILSEGIGVCDGYAEAMQLLLNTAGIECHLVFGDEKGALTGDVGHVWNIVKIDGEYYHLDATWNDTSQCYNYFNAPDSQMDKDHEWDKDLYPKSTSNRYSYIYNTEFTSSQGEWIYFSQESSGLKLYKMKADGTSKAKLNNDRSVFIASSGDWIYYSNYSNEGYLYKIKTDGSNRTMINKEWSVDIDVIDDWIYYTNGDNEKRYRIKFDGSARQSVE